MLARIFRFFRERRRTENTRLRSLGYHFAYKLLLVDGVHAIPVLTRLVREAAECGAYNQFDEGINRAIADFMRTQEI